MIRCFARECDKETRLCLVLVLREVPPCLVIKTDKDHRVVLEAFALVDGHQRGCANSLVRIQGILPALASFGAPVEMGSNAPQHLFQPVPLFVGGNRCSHTFAPQEVSNLANQRRNSIHRRWRTGVPTPELSHKGIQISGKQGLHALIFTRAPHSRRSAI